ncbi:methyl-accepting chemotaxis protein [Halodesulfovibrio aestuarii]|uniref:Methyl-accepting chemotaxis protein n=1 Tax=Halodesulfovibrio aestuarii TaxID=126333 RepID=A0ABV4JYU8_9BACT
MNLLSNISMKPKLIGYFLAVGLLPLFVIGWISSNSASDALMQQAYGQLETIKESKKLDVLEVQENWKSSLRGLVGTVGHLEESAFDRMHLIESRKKKEIETYFIEQNSKLAMLGRDTDLNRITYEFEQLFKAGAKDSEQWNRLDSSSGWRMRNICSKNGWEDLLLISSEGEIVYSSKKNSDLGQSLVSGRLKSSALAEAFKEISTKSQRSSLADFQIYTPIGERPVAFMLTRLIDARSNLGGYIAAAIPEAAMNLIAQNRTGLGTSGEAYFISLEGGKPSLRSTLVTIGDGNFGIGTLISTDYLKIAKETGKPVEGLFVDSFGTLCMVLVQPLRIAGVKWAVVVKINLEEVLANEGDDGSSLFKDFAAESGFTDLFLIQKDGYIFYSVLREADYHTNIKTGEYSNTLFGDVFKKVLETGKPAISDFTPYAPSKGIPYAFLAQPVMKDGEVQFIVALQMSLDSINKIMKQRAGMGKTGQCYLVGSDNRMRSQTFLDPEVRNVAASFAGSVKENGVDTEATRFALSGKSGTKEIISYKGSTVLSAFTPVTFGSSTWALIAEIDQAEVTTPVALLKKNVWIVSLGIGLLVAIFAYLIAISITRPLGRVVDFSKEIAHGNFDASLNIHQNDELGQLAAAVRAIPQKLREVTGTVKAISAAVSHGNLRERGDAEQFYGGYEELIHNTNALCDVFVEFLDVMPVVLMSVDKNSNILFMNKFGTHVGSDVVPEHAAGTKCFDMLNSTDCRTDRCVCDRTIESGVKEASEADLVIDGEGSHASFSAIPIRVENEVVGALKIIVDQTDITKAQRKMRNLANSAVDISSQLSSAAEELSAQIEQSSKGADIQRERAAETATSMEQMNATVLEVAQNASDAAENSEHTRTTAQSGAEAVQDVLETIGAVDTISHQLTVSMEALTAQVTSIGEVMNVINDIADQTNLLALNAAIEAARAGDAGRGFAVVADEVRKLAENTMAATDQVGSAITSIQQVTEQNMEEARRTVEAVEKSTSQAQHSGELLASILSYANDSADQVRVIATAAEEQSAAAEEVSRATEEINRISFETSQAMTQSASAVTELASLAERLNSLISEMR